MDDLVLVMDWAPEDKMLQKMFLSCYNSTTSSRSACIIPYLASAALIYSFEQNEVTDFSGNGIDMPTSGIQ